MWRHHPHSTVIRPHHALILPGDRRCSLFLVGLIRCLLSSSSPPAPPHHHHQQRITSIIILPAPFQLQEHLKLFCCYRPAFLASLTNQIDIDQRPDRKFRRGFIGIPAASGVGVLSCLLPPAAWVGVAWGAGWLLKRGENRGRPGVGQEGWPRWFAHPFWGAEYCGHHSTCFCS